MSFTDTLKNILFGQDTDNEENDAPEEEEYETEIEEEPSEEEAKPAEKTAFQPKASSGERIQTKQSGGMNVNAISKDPIEMKVVKPEKLENVTKIADFLISRKTVVLNFEGTAPETSRRIIDFLNGVAYAIDGSLRKVANRIYIVTPSNVDISGEQVSEAAESNEFVPEDKD